MTNILKTYPRSNLTFINGEGSYLIEQNGDKYLDFGQKEVLNISGSKIKSISLLKEISLSK